MTDPQLGAFGVVLRGTSWSARLIQWATKSPAYHAFIYMGNDKVIEGRPSGAGFAPVYTGSNVAWSHMPLTPQQRTAVGMRAIAKIGTGYSWLDDLAIGLAKLTHEKLPVWIRKRLSRPDRLMCSQLVDVVYREAGIQLFTDNRWPGDVSPGDLLCLINAE